MRVIQEANNVATLLKMYKVVNTGMEQAGRAVDGVPTSTRNARDLAVVLDLKLPCFTAFKARNFNLDYAKQEWLWYLTGDRMDTSILEHATAWSKLQQDDGSFFSNYGQYIFGSEHESVDSQFAYVCEQLINQPSTRRASMVLLREKHLFHQNTDTVCTYAINFTIEANVLYMTVMMRSNDVIWGFTNDSFCFWNLYQMVYAVVKEHVLGLKVGEYTHFTNSMHVYDRHYKMIANILADQSMSSFNRYICDVPLPTADEVWQLINSGGKEGDGEYSTWLKT